MTHGYSIELRARVMAALDDGMPRKKGAEVFKISAKTLFNWIKRRRETGDVQIKERPKVRSTRKLTPDNLLNYIEKYPDVDLKEIGEAFGVKGSSVFNALKKFGISLKKQRAIEKETRKRGKPSQPR